MAGRKLIVKTVPVSSGTVYRAKKGVKKTLLKKVAYSMKKYLGFFTFFLLFSCQAQKESPNITVYTLPVDELTADVLSEVVKESIRKDYLLKVDRPYEEIMNVSLERIGDNRYQGKISYVMHIPDEPFIVYEDTVSVTVAYDNRRIQWESGGHFGGYEFAYTTPSNREIVIPSKPTIGNTETKSSLDTITLKIGSSDVAFYKINFSNSTMRYLSRELNMNGLEQTAYIHKNYYDIVSGYLLTVNKILKAKRVFSDEEILTMKNVFTHLSLQNQELLSETYEYRISENSFPDNKYHGLTTSIILVELMYSMAHLYANLCVTENYQIDDLQKAIKNISTGISRDEENLFKEVFPDIFRDMLIKKFVVSANTNILPSVFFR